MGTYQQRMSDVAARAASRRQTIHFLITIIVVIGGGYWFLWWFASDHLCNSEQGFVYRSARYDAQATMIDCGATTSLNTEVTVSTPPTYNLPGTYESAVVFQSTHDPTKLSLRWESPTHLIIEYPVGEERYVRKILPTWKDVTITHRARTE